MKLSYLMAISPIDGRYANKVKKLRNIFSEYALFKYRIIIEIEWLKKLSKIKEIKEISNFDIKTTNFLESIIKNYNIKDAEIIKKIEKKTNHDIKAVEYFLKNKISKFSKLKNSIEFIHFGCTSDDINNLSYALMLKDARKNIIIPYWKKIIKSMRNLSLTYKNISLASRTHGRIASPTTIGKEISNFIYRLKEQEKKLNKIKILGKINGSVGNYNAFVAAYPKINWIKISKDFVNSLDIKWNPYTTQIEPRDYISELFSCIIRFNIIIINFSSDIWRYISINYFQQKIEKKNIGSSVMPYKINPINFENAEGNLGISNSILQYLSNNITLSKWQRDLRDSTLLRNIGIAISQSLIAYKEILKGIKTLKINKKIIKQELEKNWIIITEAIQTTMRKYNINKPYEKIKKITTKKILNKKKIKKLINNSNLPNKTKKRLNKITPSNYIGYALIMTKELEKYTDKNKKYKKF